MKKGNRKTQKKRIRAQNDNQDKKIDQEIGRINITSLGISHIIIYNPILKATRDTRLEYIKYLEKYLRIAGWDRRKFVQAEMAAYKKIILNDVERGEESHELSYYQYYILFDFMHVLTYNFKKENGDKLEKVKNEFVKDFRDSIDESIVNKILKMTMQPMRTIKRLLKDPSLEKEKEYISHIYDNLEFIQKPPANVMVTATMSAGKSTFINALTGKYVCLSQNMACTSKIHYIVNKAFEDGFSAEYDHDLVLTAGKEELLNDNDLNKSNKIAVGTKFVGGMANRRIMLTDSPGVNYSGDKTHKQITDKMIKEGDYNLLIYIMNATQLSTNDESEHMEYVKQTMGPPPILFVINKVDTFNVEEENIFTTIQRQIDILKEKGFKTPIICPVSSRAAYLAKQFQTNDLTRSEKRELYNYIDKFEQMGLPDYYEKTFKNMKVVDKETEEMQLLKTSGLAYIEKIILSLCKRRK